MHHIASLHVSLHPQAQAQTVEALGRRATAGRRIVNDIALRARFVDDSLLDCLAAAAPAAPGRAITSQVGGHGVRAAGQARAAGV